MNINETTIRRITKDLNLLLDNQAFDEKDISAILNNYFTEKEAN